ncbi:unnamed protein product [Acanthosepion pharaonis]|uniref:Uncharacterized protein n=1 Tax=Acanthosepion pharaonis TaxID=158019 RepID=A0A812DA14_ACAPH|nr:unnamed protein product [Sepia pharaonis]
MVKKALIAAEARLARALRRVGEKLQRGQRAGARLFAGDQAISPRRPDEAVSADPTAAIEAKDGVGQRSGRAPSRHQSSPKKRKVRSCRSRIRSGCTAGDEARQRDPPCRSVHPPSARPSSARPHRSIGGDHTWRVSVISSEVGPRVSPARSPRDQKR